MFSLTGFIDLPEGQAGMLIPILSAKGINLPYVQEFDEYLTVIRLSPFLDAEMYSTVGAIENRTVSVGEQGIIAFRKPDSDIFVGNLRDVFDYVKANRRSLRGDPIFEMQLLRLVAAELQELSPVFNRVAKIAFASPSQRRAWIFSERGTHNSLDRIWQDLTSEQISHRPSPIRQKTKVTDPEVLLDWLSNEENFESDDWSAVWHVVIGLLPFDERPMLLAQSWLFRHDTVPVKKLKGVLYVVLDFWRSDDQKWREMADFLSDVGGPALCRVRIPAPRSFITSCV